MCTKCNKDTFPFNNIKDEELLETLHPPDKSGTASSSKIKKKKTFNPSQLNYDIHSNMKHDLDEEIPNVVDFKFYDTQEFKQLKSKTSNNNIFSLLHTNISSLQANFEKIEELQTSLNFQFDIIALSETWNPENKQHLFSPGILTNYQNYEGITGNSLKGGCGFYVKKNICYIPRPDLDKKYKDNNSEFESKWIELIPKNKSNTLICVNYRHPRHKDTQFISYIKSIFKKINKEKKKVIFAGDFNYNLLKHDTNSKTSDFINLMTSLLLQPHILGPTRININNSFSLIDNIFLNIENKSCYSGNLCTSLSDHIPNFIFIDNMNTTAKEKKQITKRDFSKFEEQKFINDFNEHKIINSIQLEKTLNKKYSNFQNEIINVINIHAPIKTLSKRECKLEIKPWITKGIRKSIKEKNKYYKHFLKTGDKFHYHRYKSYRDKLNHLIRSNKKQHYNKYFEYNKLNIKKMWSKINFLLHKNNTDNNITSIITKNGLTNDKQLISNEFNKFYTTVASKLVKNLKPTTKKYSDYLTNPANNSFFISPTHSTEIKNIIIALDVSKSTDIYNISTKFIKLLEPKISNILCHLFNESFQSGEVPNMLKYAFVLPLHKGGSKLEVSNYRPVSILPILSKVLEKLMQNRLNKYLEDNKIIYNHQFGFQKNKSTSLAVLDVYSKLIEAIENGKYSCSVFLDFAKAFDTINHEILLKKLEYYGIRGLANKWFKSYLSNRFQKVKISNTYSEEREIKCGVPQGSVLGPILFLIYINDIKKSSTILKFHLFADDTSTLFSHKSLQVIEQTYNAELFKVSQWLISNKLSLNVSKSVMIIFNTKQKKTTHKINIKINNEQIQEKEYTKYLGILIDKHLNWSQHIHHVNLKLSRGIGILAKLRHFVSKKTLKSLYYSFIQPHVDYGLINWASATTTNLNPIRKKIKKAIRIMAFKNYKETTEPLFHDFKILNFDNYKDLNTAKFMWKLSKNKLPISISKLFNKQNSRNSLNLHLPTINTNHKKRFVSYSGIKLWNSLPTELKEISLFSAFKKKVTNNLLKK